MSFSLVVMAAGAGSRFGGPKQTTPVGPNGEWLPDFAIFDALRAGFQRVVFIIRDELRGDFESLRARVGDRVPIEFVTQRLDDLPSGFVASRRAKPWGTGQAVLTVREVVTGPFAIMNADDFYGPEAYRQGHEACVAAERDGVATVVAMRLDNTLSPFGPVKRGWAQTKNGRVTRLEEVMGIERRGDTLVAHGKHEHVTFDGSELVSMNFWVFPPSIFTQLNEKFVEFLRSHAANPEAEFLLPEVVNELIAEGTLDVLAREAPGPWFGLTYREDLNEVTSGLSRLTAERVYPSPLW